MEKWRPFFKGGLIVCCSGIPGAVCTYGGTLHPELGFDVEWDSVCGLAVCGAMLVSRDVDVGESGCKRAGVWISIVCLLFGSWVFSSVLSSEKRAEGASSLRSSGGCNPSFREAGRNRADGSADMFAGVSREFGVEARPGATLRRCAGNPGCP